MNVAEQSEDISHFLLPPFEQCLIIIYDLINCICKEKKILGLAYICTLFCSIVF